MMMTEKERLGAVLAGATVDRPPVLCPGGMMSAATAGVLRQTAGNRHNDPAAMAEVAETIRAATGFENLGVPFCLTVEAEDLGSRVDPGGAEVEPRVAVYAAAQPAAVMARPLPPPDSPSRAAVVCDAIKLLAARHDDTPVIGNLTGPMSLATSLIDPLVFFRLLRKDPAGAHVFLDYLTEYLAGFARRQAAAGADAVAIADPTATGEILGPANFRTFVRPYLRRLARTIRAAGSGVIIHICGDATLLLEEIRDMGPAALSFDSVVSMRKAQTVLEGIPLMGNISTQILHRGTPERIGQAAKHALDSGVSILAPACGVSLQTPLANLRALTDTGRRPR